MTWSPRVKRSALVVGSILLFGCGSPYAILLHNDLPKDAEFTVRWKADRTTTLDEHAFIPAGEAESVSTSWGGPPNKIDVLWRTTDGRSGKIVGVRVPETTYHVFVTEGQIRFHSKTSWDNLKQLLQGLAPLFTFCGFVALIPTAIFLLIRRARR